MGRIPKVEKELALKLHQAASSSSSQSTPSDLNAGTDEAAETASMADLSADAVLSCRSDSSVNGKVCEGPKVCQYGSSTKKDDLTNRHQQNHARPAKVSSCLCIFGVLKMRDWN